MLVQTFFTSPESVPQFPDFNTASWVFLPHCQKKRSVKNLNLYMFHVWTHHYLSSHYQTKSSLLRWFARTITAYFFSSVAPSCLTLCDPMSCSTPGLPVHHQFQEPTQTHIHWVGDATQPSHPLLSPSPPALNLSQHQGLFKWVSYLHQVAKVLEFQLQHHSFPWTPRTDLL